MNKLIKNIMLVCVLACLYSIGFSQHHHNHECTMPVDPYPKNKTQPDGEQITIKMFGDARMYYIETIDGYTITKDRKDDFYKYMTADKGGDLLLTDIIVHNADNRSQKEQNFLSRTPKKLRVTGEALKEKQALQKSLNQSTSSSMIGDFPSFGVRKALMLLIDFPDQPSTYTVNDVYRMLNEDGYNVNGQTGSFRDYYQDISYGNLTVNSDVKGWYRAANNKAFYGAEVINQNGEVISDINPEALVIEAINAAHADGVDFSQYDNDEDGVVDIVMIIHSGLGQESSGDGDDIWSHLSGVSDIEINGVSVRNYTIQPETHFDEDGNTIIANIGVLCHEFGHALGLPDLYGNSTVPGIGLWGLMGSGSWNNRARTPSHLCAWSKIQLGWIEPEVITSPTSINNMPSIDISPVSYRLNTKKNSEYFLISGRQQNGWDEGLSGQGVLIWHIDDRQSGNFLSNDLPQVYLEDIYGNADIDGTIPNADFNIDTDPDSRTHEGFDSGNCVNNIRFEDVSPNLRGAFDIDCIYDECPLAGSEFFHISKVELWDNNGDMEFIGIDNSTSYDYYSIYNQDKPTNMSAFGSYSLYVENISIEKSVWKGWIDYNQDGYFDDTELILDSQDLTSSFSFTTFTLPENLIGEFVMRIILTVPPECDNSNLQYDEIEDYVMFICDDKDEDGVCDANDCDDSNPDIPTTPSIPCDDGNPDTTDDRIREDGCTCAGIYWCEPFFELSGTINSATYIVQDYIHTDGQVTTGGYVGFIAGNHIELLPGFDAKRDGGTLFDAYIQELCPADKQELDDEQITVRNYPNPFTEQTTIEFELSKDAPVTLFVSDAMGRQIEGLLDNEAKVQGTHSATFDGSNYPAGMYYYTIQAGEYTGTQKMVLIK